MQSASSHGCLLRSLAYGMRGSALINILKRELNCDVRVLFTIQLCIRGNEIIQSLAMLFWAEFQIAAHCELHRIHVIGAEKVFSLVLLPCFRNVQANPPA